MNNKLMPAYYISHGGGPWPWLEDERVKKEFRLLKESLERLPTELPQEPKAVLVISAHWDEETFKVSSNSSPNMIYDYFGFPDNTYKVKYPASGDPDLASKIRDLIVKGGIEADLDPERGFDHGTFVPMAVSFPKADIPIVQLSLRSDFDSKDHFKVGTALKSLREEGVLIIASGLSYHNMRGASRRAHLHSHQFDQWLQKILINELRDKRLENLISWEKAPSARFAHPREDHLIPLMVAVGAAKDDECFLSYHEDNALGGFAVSSFRFG